MTFKGLKKRAVLWVINRILVGTKPELFELKRCLLCSIGCSVGKGTKIVAPIEFSGQLKIGCDCWIGKNLRVNGNGTVTIGDRCDIAPEVTFQTGGHDIGSSDRRAGTGRIFNQNIGNGVWIGGRSTIVGDRIIGNGSVIAACACVTKDVPENVLVGGVPARVIRELNE